MRKLAIIFILGSGLLVAGCGGSSSSLNPAALEAAFQECGQGSVLNLMRLANQLAGLLQFAQGESGVPGTFYDFAPGSATNTYDFTLIFDTTGDGVPDTSVVGTATFSEDPTDGLAVGATVDLSFDIYATNMPLAGFPPQSGTLTGGGDLTVRITAPDRLTVAGTLDINDSGCSALLEFSSEEPLDVVFPYTIVVGPVEAANFFGISIFGAMSAQLTTLGHTLEGILTLYSDNQMANLAGNVDGIDIDTDFEVAPDPAIVEPLVFCLQVGLELAGSIVDTIGQVTEYDLADLVAGTIPGVTLTPTANPAVYNYTIDLDVFGGGSFSNGLMQGTATVTLSGNVVTRLVVSWNFSADGVLVGSTTITGQSTRSLDVRIATDGTVTQMDGAGSFTYGDCMTTFDILQSDPYRPETDAGRVRLTSATAGHSMGATFVIGPFSFEDVTIDGIPIPPELLQFFAN